MQEKKYDFILTSAIKGRKRFCNHDIGQFTLNLKTLIIDPAGHTVMIAVISLPENGSQRRNNQQTYTVLRGIEFN